MNQPVVIVNPVSSGSELAPAFAKREVPSVAVRLKPTGGVQSKGFAHQIRSEDFVAVLEEGPDLIEKLQQLRPQAVIAGIESGVPLADQLAAQLCSQRANSLELSNARTHKAEMQKALEKSGLPVIRTLDTASTQEVQSWLVEQNLTGKPLVLKPPASAGSDNVFHVPGGEDWRQPFDHILSSRARLGHRENSSVIVQEQVTGTEYAVDTVSAIGKHHLAHLIRYQKTSRSGRLTVFDHTEFVPFEEGQHRELLEYTEQALDALGIRWGAAHSEVMLTADGPRLIETGARMCGGPVLGFARAATGASQVERVVEAYLDGEISTATYSVEKTVVPVFLSSPHEGILRNGEILERLSDLPTHLTSHLWWSNGDRVPQTVDFNTVFGIVALAGEREQVFKDYEKVRQVEARLVIE